jgi:hypothetical protein
MLIAVATSETAVTRAAQAPAVEPNSIVLEGLRAGQPCSITIEFAAIAELRAMVDGPHEVASGSVRGMLAEDRIVLAHCAAASAKEDVIGLFRTQPAGWPSETEPDAKRLEAALPKSTSAVLLVVRTLARRPWSATLFLVDPKAPQLDEPALIEFPFDEYLLKNGWLTELAPPPAPPPRRMASPSRRSRRRWWVAAAAVAAGLGIAGAAYEWKWRPWMRAAEPVNLAEPAVVPPIGLTATRSLDEVAVTWNRSSELVRAATAGTLIIRNGPVTRMVAVTPAQLRQGQVMYHPLSGVDSEFRLEMTMPDGRTEAESIQFVGFDTTPALTLPVAARKRPAPESSADRLEVAPAPPRRESPPAAGPPTEPQPIRRVNPLLNRDVVEEMRNAKGLVTMSVLVNIDAAGKVDSARIVAATGEPSPSGSHIRLAALNAARQWRFRPATAGGRAVPSTLTLPFSF